MSEELSEEELVRRLAIVRKRKESKRLASEELVRRKIKVIPIHS